MKEITTTDSFIGGSSANMDWANEGYGGKKTTKKRTASEPKAKRASSKPKPKPKAKRTSSKKKTTATKKRATSKKRGGAQHISSSPIPGPKPVIANGTDDFSTEQRIMAPIDVWSLSPPGLYTKYKIAKNVLGRKQVFNSTAEDEQGLQDMVMRQNEVQGAEDTAQENIYNTTVTPAQRARFNGTEEAGEDAGDIAGEDAGEEAGDIAGEAGEFGDAADVIEGLGDFLGIMFGAGKGKNKKPKVLKKRNKTKKPTKAQWKKKKADTIKKVAKNKKLMKKVGSGFLDFLKSIPEGVDDAFVQIHNAFTGDKPASYQPSAFQRSDWNTWGLTPYQIDKDVYGNPLTTSLKYAYRHQVHHPQYQRDVWEETAAAQGGKKGGARQERQKTQEELELVEAKKRERDAKKRFDTALREYYTDLRQRWIDEFNLDTKNDDIKKELSKRIALHKKENMDKFKARVSWGMTNAYVDVLNSIRADHVPYYANRTGLGKKKSKAKPKAKKPATKKKAPAKKKAPTKKK